MIDGKSTGDKIVKAIMTKGIINMSTKEKKLSDIKISKNR